MKSLIKDFFMVLFLLAVCGYAGRLLYNDLTQTIENTDGVPIGSVQFSNNVTQRKYAGRVVWETLPQQAIVYNNDTIRTAEESEIVLTMEDGTEITLGANTLITLNFSDEEKNIEFQGGNISASSAEGSSQSSLQIKTEDTVIALNDASINLKKQEGEEVSFAVLKGNVELESGGIKQEIKENEQVDFSGGQATIKELDLIPQRPLNNSFQLSYSEQKLIDFNWNYTELPDTLDLIISQKNDMSEAVLEQAVGEKNFRTTLAPGVYFWQLKGTQNGIEIESPITKFTLLRDDPVIPMAPANAKEIEYRQNIPSVSFRWDGMKNADYYLLEVGTTSDMAAPLHSRQVTGTSLSISGFSEGQYFWRITPHVALGQLGFQNPTPVYSFSTLHNEIINPPQLKYPPAESVFSNLETREGLRFNWSRISEARDYRIVISNSSILDNPIIDLTTEDNYYQSEREWTEGTYYWQVSCTSRTGEAIPPSEIRSFKVEEFKATIELIQPEDNTFLVENQGYPQRFSWKGNAEQYHFTLYKVDRGKEELISESTTGATSLISVLPGDGNYLWSVDILDYYSGAVIGNSPEYSLNIDSPFSPPFVILPASDSYVSLIGEDKFTIRWLEADKADYYTGKLVRNRDGRNVAVMNRTSGTNWEITVNDSWETGNYSFYIQSHRNNAPAGYSKESEETIYTIRIQDIVLFEAAVPTLPADGSSFTRLGIMKDGMSFSWTGHPLLKRYSIDLFRNGGKFPYRTLFSETNAIELNDMEDGNYQWQIHAWDDRGNQAPDSILRRFSVSPVPELSRPEMVSPVQGATVNMDTADSLDFKWNPISNAGYYRLVLTNNSSGDILFVKDNYEETSFSYTKLEKLDIGQFKFEIQAFREYPEIGIKQSSPLAEINFSLSLETAAEAPVIITSGSLYAE